MSRDDLLGLVVISSLIGVICYVLAFQFNTFDYGTIPRGSAAHGFNTL